MECAYNPIVIQFVNFHVNGRESRWCLTYDWGTEGSIDYGGTVDEMEIRSDYHQVDFTAVEGEALLIAFAFSIDTVLAIREELTYIPHA